jgi:[acyl-carrier-protein] S-malonyltransferase
MVATRTAWIFPGQGSQFVGMGWDLWRDFAPANRILEIASRRCDHDLRDLCLRGPADALVRTDVLQPALTALTLGCVALLDAHGFRPDVVAGHSLGEYAALYAANVLSIEETLDLVTERGRLMQEVAEAHPGAMLAVVGLSEGIVEHILGEMGNGHPLVIANYNTPTQLVLSGDADAIHDAAHRVAALGGHVQSLPVSGAWHSPLMAEARERFARTLDAVTFKPATVPVYLNALGTPETDSSLIRDAMYRQIDQPVLWRHSVDRMLDHGVRTFIEVGAGKVLRGLVRRIAGDMAGLRLMGVDGPRTLALAAAPHAAPLAAQVVG